MARHPDHNAIAVFRQQHLEARSKRFVQVLRLCRRAGLVKLGTVVIDDTMLHTNASPARSISAAGRLTKGR